MALLTRQTPVCDHSDEQHFILISAVALRSEELGCWTAHDIETCVVFSNM